LKIDREFAPLVIAEVQNHLCGHQPAINPEWPLCAIVRREQERTAEAHKDERVDTAPFGTDEDAERGNSWIRNKSGFLSLPNSDPAGNGEKEFGCQENGQSQAVFPPAQSPLESVSFDCSARTQSSTLRFDCDFGEVQSRGLTWACPLAKWGSFVLPRFCPQDSGCT
jgi:hypothetical protein